MQNMFTDNVKRVLQLAREESGRLGHDYIGTEHLLLGLIKQGEGVAVTALINMGLDLEMLRQSIEDAVASSSTGMSMPIGQPPFTPRAKQILEDAHNEARQMKNQYVGTEHLLLALIKHKEGIASQGRGRQRPLT